MKKKILSFILVLTIISSLFSSFFVTVSAVTDGTCGDDLVWTFDQNHGTLTISGTGKMNNYFGSGQPSWGNFKEDIKEVIIDDGVTSIGSAAFYNYTNIRKVVLGKSIKDIGDYAFFNCTHITDIYWNSCNVNDFANNKVFYSIGTEQSGVTVVFGETVNVIPANVFCTSSFPNVKNIIIGDNVSSIGKQAFMNCDKVTDITIGKNVKEIGHQAFWGNKSVSTINWKALNAKDFNESNCAFSYVGANNSTGVCVYVGNGVKHLPANLFHSEISTASYFANVKNAYIPKSLQSIGVRAFSPFAEIDNVYFEGNKKEFNNIVNFESVLYDETSVHYQQYKESAKQEQSVESEESGYGDNSDEKKHKKKLQWC